MREIRTPAAPLSTAMAAPDIEWNAIRSDREAFYNLVGPLAPIVLGVIRRELGTALSGRIETEDLVQETWLRAYRSIESFRGPGMEEFRAWLLRIAVRTVQDAGRRHARVGRGGGEVPLDPNTGGDAIRGAVQGNDLAASDPTPGRIVERQGRYERFQAALASLDEDHRTVIELVRLQGLPVKEAAGRMGRSPNATSMLLFRALLQLKQRFGHTESLHLAPRKGQEGDSEVETREEEEAP